MMKAVAIGDWRLGWAGLGWARNTSTWQAYDRSENLSVRFFPNSLGSPHSSKTQNIIYFSSRQEFEHACCIDH